MIVFTFRTDEDNYRRMIIIKRIEHISKKSQKHTS